MDNQRKTILAIFTACVFVVLMMFNVNSTEEGFDFSLCGETVLANDLPCIEEPDVLFFDNIQPWHPANCFAEGNGCLTCTVPPAP
ncbi:MAG: hypothetical protein JJU37_03725 [Balneolaceae bacterium]|nr:hypothetical protein [Balneolaceae bacterium]